MPRLRCLFVLLAAISVVGTSSDAAYAAGCPQIQVCFSPVLPGGCDPQRAILDAIAGAHRSVFVQAYDLTSLKIADALSSAARHGIDTRVLLDPANAVDYYERRAIRVLLGAGVAVAVDRSVKLAHNKVMIIDEETVLTGSFNFTKSAEYSNAENLVVIHDSAVAAQYRRNWDYHASRSDPYRPR